MSTAVIICIIVSCIVAVIAAVVLVLFHLRPHLYKASGTEFSSTDDTVEFVASESVTPYLLKRKKDGSISDEDFKILTCTDTHINSDESELTFTLLERFLNAEKPDLVILVGDNVVNRLDVAMQEKLKVFFEKRKQYWGFVLGNHDSERKIKCDIDEILKSGGTVSAAQAQELTTVGRKWMFSTLSGGAHCIVKDEGGEGVYGVGNCIVNIKNSKGISQSLFFLDSGDYVYGIKRKTIGTEKRCYNYLRESQLEWYGHRLDEITEENGGNTPKSIAFFHIPLPEFQKAFAASRLRRNGAKLVYGMNYERVCSSNIDVGAFETFRAADSTKIIVCGHDHKNDSCIEYKGVKLMYSQGLQYDGAYNRRKKSVILKLLNRISDKFCCYTEGVSIFLIKCDGSVDVGARYAQKEKLYYGLEKYFDRAFLRGTVKSGTDFSKQNERDIKRRQL